MPNWKYHITFSLVLFVLEIKALETFDIFFSLSQLFILLLFVSFLSVLPDVDTSSSRIRNLLAVFSVSLTVSIFLLIGMERLEYYGFVGIVYLFVRFFPTRHRGITHTLYFGALLCSILSLILWWFGFFKLNETLLVFLILFSSHLSHLVLDKQFK
ncbi:MAG: metal-dependent hydrolase [Candidatus Aenigmarchaeota archaeon]|nr:metal-dependent hydrolase [Candidatus Aenigmarchaeota archaeon]